MPGVPTLTDGTVTLRAHREEDAAGVTEQSVDPTSIRWTTVPVPYTLDAGRDFVTRTMPDGWADGTAWGFAVEVQGRYAATVELRDEGGGRAEIAFGSAPWVRGTGAMERACRLLLAWGFSEHGIRTVVWHAHVGNWASRRLAWRLGFSFGGTLRGYVRHRGELVDAWSGTLLSTDERAPRSPWLETPTLTDGVVRLRAVRSEDTEQVVEAAGDERTQRWLGRMPSPYTPVEAAQWLEQVTEEAATGRTVTWAVTRGDDVLRGVVNLFDIQPGNAAEVGFWAHPQARGGGLTTRATALALRHGFATFDLVRIQGHAAVGNLASRHVLEASGLREAGIARLGTFIRPEGRVDAVKYDVLVEEWRASRRAQRG
jgi:RimJ/RimL family protein N-acetyltransferase